MTQKWILCVHVSISLCLLSQCYNYVTLCILNVHKHWEITVLCRNANYEWYCHKLRVPVHIYMHFHYLHTDMLGGRLESEMDGMLRDNAGLCYICSGNVVKFVEWWYVRLCRDNECHLLGSSLERINVLIVIHAHDNGVFAMGTPMSVGVK